MCLKETFGYGRLFSSSSGHSGCSTHVFQTAGPNPMKLVPLETRLIKLSRVLILSNLDQYPRSYDLEKMALLLDIACAI